MAQLVEALLFEKGRYYQALSVCDSVNEQIFRSRTVYHNKA